MLPMPNASGGNPVTPAPARSRCSTAACIAAALHTGQSPRTGTAARRARAIRTAPERGGSRRGPAAAVAFHRRATEPGDRRVVPTVPLAQPPETGSSPRPTEARLHDGTACAAGQPSSPDPVPVDRKASTRGGRTPGQRSPDVTRRPRSHVRQQDVSQRRQTRASPALERFGGLTRLLAGSDNGHSVNFRPLDPLFRLVDTPGAGNSCVSRSASTAPRPAVA